VFSISVNGSPIASGNEDIVINVPIGNGEVRPGRHLNITSVIFMLILGLTYDMKSDKLAD